MIIAKNEQKIIPFITFLQFIAVFLITWDHMVGTWADWNQFAWIPLKTMRQYVNLPFGIIQDFGFIGVSIIFLTSGFLMTLVAQSESRREFGLKRLFKIYPPLIFSIILIIAFNWLYAIGFQTHTNVQDFSLQSILLSFSLMNYFVNPQNVLNGIAWILAVQIIFYAECFLLLPLLKNKPKIALGIIITFTTLIITLARQFETSFFLFAVSNVYILFIIIGQIVYYFWKRKINFTQFLAFFIITMVICEYGLVTVNPQFSTVKNSYLISFAYAFAIFASSLLLAPRIKFNRIVGFFSEISFSFYLNQTTSYLWFLALLPLLGFELTLGTVFALLTLLAYFSWRFVEEPSKKLARKLSTIQLHNNVSKIESTN